MYRKLENKLYKKYIEKVVPKIMEEFSVKNIHEVPQIEKVLVNMGIKKAKDDKSLMEESIENISSITGQKAVPTKARKSISNFAVREGTLIGCMVTLRSRYMYYFIEKLLDVVIPRIRDFSGINRSFDRFGNLTVGLPDVTIFPEIDADKIKHQKGLSITFVTDKPEKDKSVRLIELLGFPFKK